MAIQVFGRPCGHLAFQETMWPPGVSGIMCASGLYQVLSRATCQYGPLTGHVASWTFEGPCGPLRSPVATWPFSRTILPSGSLGGHVAIWPFRGPCGHLVSQGSCAQALRKDMLLPGPLKGRVAIWSFQKPCGLLKPRGRLAFFRGHMAIQVFGWAIWFFGRPCGHLVSQGSCAHLALRKDMWLPGPLKGHVSMWPFEGPCVHLAI